MDGCGSTASIGDEIKNIHTGEQFATFAEEKVIDITPPKCVDMGNLLSYPADSQATVKCG